jgi:LPS-assembly lipoprotein
MSSSRHFVRAALVALALLATAALSSCTGLRPVYGQPGTGVERYGFFYGAPASRLDQVIYNDLRLRLGPHSTAADAVKVTITASNGARVLTKTNPARPSTAYEMIVVANVTVVGPDGKTLFSGQRRASADYVVVSQVLADTAAAQDAAERAARSVAETIRLTIISVLERP